MAGSAPVGMAALPGELTDTWIWARGPEGPCLATEAPQGSAEDDDIRRLTYVGQVVNGFADPQSSGFVYEGDPPPGPDGAVGLSPASNG